MGLIIGPIKKYIKGNFKKYILKDTLRCYIKGPLNNI